MGLLFVLEGLPGAGKSTFARLFSKEIDFKYISSDDLREEFEQYATDNVIIFNIMNKRTIEFLNKGINVIYDATNLERKYRIDLYKKVKKTSCNSKIIVVFIHQGMEIAINQNQERKNREDVTKELIRYMYNTMQIPIIGMDCDNIMIPIIEKDDKDFNITNKIFYGEYENELFQKRVMDIDRYLLDKDNELKRNDKV